MVQAERLGIIKYLTSIFSFLKIAITYSTADTCSGEQAGRGQSAPLILLTGKFLLTYRKKRGKEKWRRKDSENGKVENWKWKEEKLQNEERTFVFVFVCLFLLFLFLLFWFCFFAFHFSKPLKFVLGLPKWEFSTRKIIQKNDFESSEKYSSYAPAYTWYCTATINFCFARSECQQNSNFPELPFLNCLKPYSFCEYWIIWSIPGIQTFTKIVPIKQQVINWKYTQLSMKTWW